MIKFLSKSLSYLLLSLFLLMSVLAFMWIKENYDLFTVKLLRLIITAAVFLGVLYLSISNKISTRSFLVLLLSCSFVVRIGFITLVETPLLSDFLLMYNTANEYIQHSAEAFHIRYYDFAVFNIPFTLYLALLLKLSSSILVLKMLNVLFSVGIVYLILKISKTLFGENASRIAGTIACFFPPFIIYTGILTNQTLSIFFLLTGILYLLKDRNYLLAGLFIGLGQLFRPIGIIFLIGSVLWIAYIFIMIYPYTRKELKKTAIACIKPILPYHLILILASILLIALGVTKHTLYHDPAPSYKLLVGLNQVNDGSYLESDAQLLVDNTSEDFEREAKILIQERLSNKKSVMALVERKFDAMWSQQDASFFWADFKSSNILLVTNYVWVTILFFCFYYMYTTRKMLLEPNVFFLLITLTGFIFLYLFIEIQTRYRYELYPIFIIIAAGGVANFFSIKRSPNK